MTEPGSDPAKLTECWCCGAERAAGELVRLGCHDEVGLCEGCIGWLADRRGGHAVRRTVPILATGDVSRALAHYAALGFDAELWEGGGYGFVKRDGVELLHVGEREDFDVATNTVSCYLHVRDADAHHAEWSAVAVAGELVAPFNTDYGLREGSHTDPDGNVVRCRAATSTTTGRAHSSTPGGPGSRRIAATSPRGVSTSSGPLGSGRC